MYAISDWSREETDLPEIWIYAPSDLRSPCRIPRYNTIFIPEYLDSGAPESKTTLIIIEFYVILHRKTYKLDLISFWPASTESAFPCLPVP